MAFGFGTNILKGFIESQGMPKGKPRDVEAPKIDLFEVLGGLVKAASGRLPEINELVSAVNLFVSDEAQRVAERFVPGFTATQAAQMGAARDLSEGRLPKPVLEALRSEGAARNIRSGTLASASVPEGFANFSHLFRTAEEALQGIGFGSQLASQAATRARAFAPDLASPFSFLFSPGQALEAERFNEVSRFNVESADAIKDWLKPMRETHMWNALAQDVDATIGTVAGAFTGGALGGMGGMGGMMGGMGGGGGAGGAGGAGGMGNSGWEGFLNLFGQTGYTTDSFGNRVKKSGAKPNY